jgi:hypothetical protein
VAFEKNYMRSGAWFQAGSKQLAGKHGMTVFRDDLVVLLPELRAVAVRRP